MGGGHTFVGRLPGEKDAAAGAADRLRDDLIEGGGHYRKRREAGGEGEGQRGGGERRMVSERNKEEGSFGTEGGEEEIMEMCSGARMAVIFELGGSRAVGPHSGYERTDGMI